MSFEHTPRTPISPRRSSRPRATRARRSIPLAYNRVDSTLAATNYETLTFNVSHLLRRNVRWLAEYTHDLNGKGHRFFTGLMTAF